jgi:hypothetical protein
VYPLANQLTADLSGYGLQRGESIQLLDSYQGSAQVLLSLGLRQATRFIDDFPLFLDPESPSTQTLRREFEAALEANPPRVFVVFQANWAGGARNRVATFPELVHFLTTQYRADKTVQDGYTIYVRR